MFSRNTPRNTKHSLYIFRISCEFRVFLLLLRKNKPRNPLTFCTNADLGAKFCKIRKKESETRKNWRKIPRYTLFVFRIFRDKCIAGLDGNNRPSVMLLDRVLWSVWSKPWGLMYTNQLSMRCKMKPIRCLRGPRGRPVGNKKYLIYNNYTDNYISLIKWKLIKHLITGRGLVRVWQ